MKAAALAPLLARSIDPERTSIDDAWVGLEPTFQSKKCIKLYEKLEDDEDAYFAHSHMTGMVHAVARDIGRAFGKGKRKGAAWALFDDVEIKDDVDPWKVLRCESRFTFPNAKDTFDVKFGMDPATFELGIKPVPLQWLLDDDFVAFLQKLAFDVPAAHGLSPSMLNGGGQFHVSAKCFMQGSLLADDIATRLDHPELSTWIMDWPNCDDRALRASTRRAAAFRAVLDDYWRGSFHPKAIGVRTVEDALFDRGFDAASAATTPAGLMTESGPKGTAADVFRTNFAFGRAMRMRAQAMEPGYWQLAHPDDDGYRPDQIARYSEANGNRLQIAGELHVKSGRVLDGKRVPELSAALEPSMLATEASWELRGHMSRTSARDYVEAVFLDVNHARWLLKNPRPKVRASLAQDQLLGEAEATIKKHKGTKALASLKRAARKESLALSKGRVKSDFVEPETLFWVAWSALSKGAKAEVAREAVGGFLDVVERATSMDPRGPRGDPMEEHRHRVHPLLWRALAQERSPVKGDRVRRELEIFESEPERFLARRPVYSQVGEPAPWPGR